MLLTSEGEAVRDEDIMMGWDEMNHKYSGNPETISKPVQQQN